MMPMVPKIVPVQTASDFFAKYGIGDVDSRIDQNLGQEGVQTSHNLDEVVKDYESLPPPDQYAAFIHLKNIGDLELLKS